MRLRFIHVKVFCAVVLLIWQWSCAHTESARFYVLNSLPGVHSENTMKENPAKVVLGIGPIKLPEYLDRPQIMSRSGGNELEYTEFHQWAEPLKDNFARVLGENLSVLIPTNRIYFFPWKRSAGIDFQLEVDVIRFEGSLEGDSFFTVRWTLYGKDRSQPLLLEKSTFRQTPAGKDYEAMVSALNQTLEQFSRVVAKAIHSFISPQT